MLIIINPLCFFWISTIHTKAQDLWKKVWVGLHFCAWMKNANKGWMAKKRTCHFTSGSAHSHSLPVLGKHTRQEWHPTHQLSSHVKFTQCADRQRSSHVCCVSICLCMHVWVCGCLYCMCLRPSVCLRGRLLLVLRMSRMDVILGEHLTQSSREKINSGNNK